MYPNIGNTSQVGIVWFVLVGDEQELESLHKLDSVQRGHAQVEKEAIKNGKWEEVHNTVEHDREAHENGHDEQGHSLLPVGEGG